MQIKSIMKYHLTLVRMAILKKRSGGKHVGKREPACIVGGNVNCGSHYGNSMDVPQKITNRTTI